MARDYSLAFYNLDNNRDPAQVTNELRGILTGWRPAVLGVCEASYDLPGVDGWRLPGRDRSRPGRENVAAYVKNNLEVTDVKWHDCHETWTRTNPGASGQHPPRSILEFRAGRLHVWIAHQPPKWTDNTQNAQMEGIDKLEARMAPWTREDWSERTQNEQDEAYEQARVVLWDANRNRNEQGPGPGMLQQRIAGWTAGGRIDCATWRGGDCKGADSIAYPTTADGVPLKSDHGSAFRFTLSLFDE